MTNTKRLLLIELPLVALVLLATFIAGANVGVQHLINMEGAAKAKHLTNELNLLREGKAERLIDSKEISLDSEIGHALDFQASKLGWMYFNLAPENDQVNNLRDVARYRQQHASPTSSLVLDADSERLQNEMQRYQAEIVERNERLLDECGE